MRTLQREPIYVTGAIANPGAYAFVPGMTVLHALALAGGPPGSGSDLWCRLDLAREQERLRQTELALARLESKQAVLDAEAADRPAVPPASLVAFVGRTQALELVNEAAALRSLERSRSRSQDEAYALVVEALENEYEVIKEAMAASEGAIDLRRSRVDMMNDMQDRGLGCVEIHLVLRTVAAA